MLVRSFINASEIHDLITWGKKQNFRRVTTTGENSFYTMLKDLNNFPTCINSIRKNCQEVVKGLYQEPSLKDFVHEILPEGYVSEHVDPTIIGYKHLRCNVLVQKPLIGGLIIMGKTPISLNAGDMYVVDTAIPHSVSKVGGDINYQSLVFGFLC